MDTTTLIICLCLGIGATIGLLSGLYLAWMTTPRGLDEAWSAGYQAAVEDAEEDAEKQTAALTRKKTTP